MKGADYIAEFLFRHDAPDVFLVNGGACAFMIDSVARHPNMRYIAFQHEQSAAMAADAVWRVDRGLGATMATSGPGATNLITGIACSYFDSIPAIHITGQVNKHETAAYNGANVRQAGFQETKIVDMVRPITKYAAQVTDADSLRHELAKAVGIARTGRMGPVLVDVPIDVQQLEVGDTIEEWRPPARTPDKNHCREVAEQINGLLSKARRPVILFGAGVGLAGAEKSLSEWLKQTAIPFVSSWNGLTYFNHDINSYVGQIGVYGNRGANFVLQNADLILVFGSRFDNRQRSGNAKNFAPQAHVHAVDVDEEELKKSMADGYSVSHLNLSDLPAVLENLVRPQISNTWFDYVAEMKGRYFRQDISTFAAAHGTMSPYAAIPRINEIIAENAIVPVDTGANLCWIFQSFHRTKQLLMTAGGNSPMGYSLPAAIAAAFRGTQRQVICFIGDGGLQMNIQELQTVRHYGLDIKIFVFNNHGYGIIKQFQDSYMQSRYAASGDGYSVPDLEKIAYAYGLDYARIENVDMIKPGLIDKKGPMLIDLQFHPNTLTEPKLEMGRPINDQFPYMSDEEFAAGNRFVPFARF